MLGRSIILGRKLLIPQNTIVKNYHSPGGIPGEVLNFFLHTYIT